MSRPTRLLAPALTVAAALTPGAANAAQISVDRACYADPAQRADTVVVSGTEFTPNSPFQSTLDGQALAGLTGTSDTSGRVTGSFLAPSLANVVGSGTLVHTFTLGVQQGANAPSTTFTVSRLLVSFKPASGDPKTLKVRFSLHGFGLAGAVNPTIYLHYVRPSGKPGPTYKLGVATGPCGALTTARRHLFPFRVSRGSWRLQFDTSPKYVRGASSSPFLFYTLSVTVKTAKR